MENSDAERGAAPPEAMVRVLLAVAAASLTALVICAWGWRRAATAELDLAALAPEERQALAEELTAASPGVFLGTWFQPQMGYTLRRGAELDFLGDSFRSNEIGYRTGQAPKDPRVFRVVFVGDSWTYGMGVRAAEAYPQVFARLANEQGGLERPIEAWNLALPGYNLINSLAALEFLFERLAPDAVVVCPSSNDNDSSHTVLPTGSLSRVGVQRDEFGDPHAVTYLSPVSSHRARARWRTSFDRLRAVEDRLHQRGVPLLLFFLARWQPAEVHAHVVAAGLSSPYLIVPAELTQGEWISDASAHHGTPAANQLYARMVYRGAAHLLGWPPLPEHQELAVTRIFDAPPPENDWQVAHDRLQAKAATKFSTSFRPSQQALHQAAGRLNVRSGLMGRATTILVRRRADTRRLDIAVRRLPEAPSLYPLELTVHIPSPSGGSRAVSTVPADGPEVHHFRIDIPDDLEPGSVLDIVFVAERSIAGPLRLAPRSVMIESIEPGE